MLTPYYNQNILFIRITVNVRSLAIQLNEKYFEKGYSGKDEIYYPQSASIL